MDAPSYLRTMLFAVGVLGGSVALLGCPKEPEVSQASPAGVNPVASAPKLAQAKPGGGTTEAVVPRVTPPSERTLSPTPAPAAPVPAAFSLRDIFFDFDTAVIREDQKAGLNDDITWLRAHPRVKMTIEGYCDERGTEEYNLALGQRRAEAVRAYLVAAGIPADQLATISYGKERPFVLGHDENAWRLNRRDHLVAAAEGGLQRPAAAGPAGAGKRTARP